MLTPPNSTMVMMSSSKPSAVLPRTAPSRAASNRPANVAIVLEAIVVAVLALGAQWVLGTLGVWSVLVANVLAVAAMGWYVWQTHPLLRRRLTQEPIRVHT